MAKLNGKNKFKTAYHNIIRLKSYASTMTIHSAKQIAVLFAKYKQGFKFIVNDALVFMSISASSVFKSSFHSNAKIKVDKVIKAKEKHGFTAKAATNLQSFIRASHAQAITVSSAAAKKISLKVKGVSSFVSIADYNLVKVYTLLKPKFISSFRSNASAGKTISLKDVNEKHGFSSDVDLSLEKRIEGQGKAPFKFVSSLQRNLKIKSSEVHGFTIKCVDELLYVGKMLSGGFKSFLTSSVSINLIKGFHARAKGSLVSNVSIGVLKKISSVKHLSSQMHTIKVNAVKDARGKTITGQIFGCDAVVVKHTLVLDLIDEDRTIDEFDIEYGNMEAMMYVEI